MPTRILALALLLALGLAAVAADVTLPTWPQTRTLAAGASAGIPLPVTKAGTVTMTLTWKNGPLTATLMTPSQTAVPIRLATSPMRVPVTVTPADVQKGPGWMLVLAVPATARLQAPVEVTLNVEGAEADLAAVRAFVARSTPVQPTRMVDLQKRFWAGVQAEIDANAKAQTTQIANQRLLLSTRLLNSTSKVVNAGGLPTGAIRPGMLVEPARLTNLTTAQPAKLLALTPANGIPGDIVTLRATDLVPAERWSPEYVPLHTEVWFTINPNLAALAAITGVSKDATGATLLQVRVPTAAATVVNGYNGTVSIKSTSYNYTTNTQPFRWDPTPKPVISSLNPAQGFAGNWVALKGQNFRPTDQVLFINEAGVETLAELRYVSALELQAKIPALPQPANAAAAPAGALPLPRTVNIYVKSTVNNLLVTSNKALFQLLPPPTIGSLDRISGLPGESLLINGVGFQNPVVHFTQQGGGKDYAVRPSASEWNATQVYVTVPEIPLVPINGMPLNVTVESAGVRSAAKVFTLMPIMVEMPLTDIAWINFQKQDVSDSASYWDGTAHLNHYAEGFFDYHSGTDKVAPTVTLKHGWKVVRIVTSGGAEFIDYVHGHANLTVPPVTATDLSVKVDWWVRAQGGVSASVAYIIRGPKGVPYK